MNHAILDSGCTKTVCGASWQDSYLESLSEDNLAQVTEEISSKFTLRDGKIVASLKSITIPTQIRNCEITMQTDVINNDLPLLLRKEAVKRANCQTDFI